MVLHTDQAKRERSRGQVSSWDCAWSGQRYQRELIWLFWAETEPFPPFPPPWEVGDLITRGDILGKHQMTAYLNTAVPSTSAGRLPTQFPSTALCPCDPQHHQPHFIWRAREAHFSGHSPRFRRLIKNHDQQKLVKINVVTSHRLTSVAIGAGK